MADLDVEKADRKVWLVRVPPYVAKQWNEAIKSAAELPVEDTLNAKIGHVTVQEGGIPQELTVPGLDGAPQRLYMNLNRDAADTSILSWEPDAQGSMHTPKVEGYVFRRFDAAPVYIPLPDAGQQPVKQEVKQEQQRRGPAAAAAAAAAAGSGRSMPGSKPQGKVDAAYLANTRQRLAAAKPATARRVTIIEDDRELARLAGGTKDAPLYVKNRQAKHAAAAAARAAGEARKRVRLSRDDLEERLMELFSQQSHWHFAQIQKTLEQPITWVKEVLNEVAVQVVRGPYKDQWELKDVYRESAARQRTAAAAGAAAAAAGGGSGA